MKDLSHLRRDFPVLSRTMNGRPLVYLDSGATSQKPASVLEAMDDFYRTAYANVHRGAYQMAIEATDRYEQARIKVAHFVNAAPTTVVFVRSATAAINHIAHGWGLYNLKEGDRILATTMEHHANLIPWQLLCRLTGAELIHVPFTPEYRLDLNAFREMLDQRVKLVAVTAASNVLGTVNPVREITDAARQIGARSVVDAAQSVPHLFTDFGATGADWLVFSGHKMLGPTGIGVMVGRAEVLDGMEPAEGGGEMIREVELTSATFADPPQRFEAGTPPIVEAIGLGAAVDYLEKIGMNEIEAHEVGLTTYALARLAEIPGLRVYGPSTADQRTGVLSFTMPGTHPHDIATVLDQEGIAIRAGHHCARPLVRILGLAATARASFYLYNTKAEVDALVAGLHKTAEIFRVA